MSSISAPRCCPTASNVYWKSRSRSPAVRACCCSMNRRPEFRAARPRERRPPVHRAAARADGVPEDERHEILAAVAALPSDVTVLLIEHDMDIVFSFADRISVLVNGALFVEGTPEEVARDPRVKAVYLGEELADA